MQETTPERLRKVPLYGQGEMSWACKREKCGGCTKLTCGCTCHSLRTKDGVQEGAL
jgi:hypothetical protein